jgi:hypothetical protein
MANVINWQGDWTARATSGNSGSDVMTDTELSAVADNGVTIASPAFNNASNGDTYGEFWLDVDFVASPTSQVGFVNIYAILSRDGGVTYSYVPTVSTDLGAAVYLATIKLPASTAAISVPSNGFSVPPGFQKFIAWNKAGTPFPTGAGMKLKLYVNNDELQ